MRKFLREHLQLMELLICILFFMAGSLMAVSLFLRASQVEKQSQELQSAVNAAQQQAELLRISDVLTGSHAMPIMRCIGWILVHRMSMSCLYRYIG